MTIDATDSGTSLIPHFVRTVTALRRGDKKTKEAVPSVDHYEKHLKHQPKVCVVEGNEFDIRVFANNQLEKIVFTKCTSLLPKGIYRLEFLRELKLIDCRLEEIPERISNLKKTLTVLDLSYNKLSKLDASKLCCLRQLTSLNLSKNEIKQIPLEVVFLRNLSVLDVSYNKLSKIPFTIGLLNKLRHLNLSHNQLQYFPESILRPPTAAIKVQRLQLDHLDLSANEPSVPFVESPFGPDSSQPLSLLSLAAGATIRSSLCLKMIQEWLPCTVYDDLQDQAAICSVCKGPSISAHLIQSPIKAHFNLLTHTLISDTSTQRMPIVLSICPVCCLKRNTSIV